MTDFFKEKLLDSIFIFGLIYFSIFLNCNLSGAIVGKGEIVYKEEVNINGNRKWLALYENKLGETPIWRPDIGDIALSFGQAADLINSYSQKNRDFKKYKNISRIELKQYKKTGRWFYIVTCDRDRFFGIDSITFIVLTNGEILSPEDEATRRE
jgi:hypothetical protein